MSDKVTPEAQAAARAYFESIGVSLDGKTTEQAHRESLAKINEINQHCDLHESLESKLRKFAARKTP